MIGAVLVACGIVLAAVGTWRSYAVARQVVAPLVHEGDPTRQAIEARRPLPLRPRVQVAARRLAVSLGWLLVAFYGLYLITRGQLGA
ncbi:MAG TPA: hypothetical protein VF763_14705 [Candidatus Limnocylindrales bacterium]